MPTRVLVFEYLSSGALDAQADSESMGREGRAMLSAVRADLWRCPGVEVVEAGAATPFRDAARRADWALVIAPEFDDLLARYAGWACEAGCRLLCPSVEAIRLTADKLRLAEDLQRSGVPTIPTADRADPPAVVKPRFGAGSQATFLVRTEAEVRAALDAARADGFTGERIAQPYWPGRHGPLSMACLVGPSQRFCLPLMRQLLSDDGRFRYLGGERAVGVDERPYRETALAALDAVPGLFGYVGFDLLWPAHADRPVVVEINPRLTTSYVGLRALAAGNLMQTLLDLAAGRPAAPPAFRDGPVWFTAAGEVSG